MPSLANRGKLERGEGKNVEECEAIVNYGRVSSHWSSALIFRCSQATVVWCSPPKKSWHHSFPLEKSQKNWRFKTGVRQSNQPADSRWHMMSSEAKRYWSGLFQMEGDGAKRQASPSESRHALHFIVFKRFYYLCNSLSWLWLSLNILLTFNRCVSSHVEPTFLSSASAQSASFQDELSVLFAMNKISLHKI